MRTARAITVFAAALTMLGSSAIAQRVEVTTNLAPTENGYMGSEGDAELRVRGGRTDFKVEIEDVPDGEYWVYVDGVVRSNIVVVLGEGEIEFADPPRRGKLALDFDPDGALVEIVEGESRILAGLADFVADAYPASMFPKQNVNQTMTVADPAQSSRAKCKVKFKSNTKKAELRIDGSKLLDGTYTLIVGGETVGTLETRRGKIKQRFSTKAKGNDLPLTFDPTGKTIDLMREGVMAFTTGLDAQSLGGGILPLGEIERDLVNTGVDFDASGDVRLRTRPDETDFDVEIEDVPVGVYDLLIDGFKTGEITVVVVPGGTEGEIEFSTNSDDADELPLTFEPLGRTIQVSREGVVYLSLVFE